MPAGGAWPVRYAALWIGTALLIGAAAPIPTKTSPKIQGHAVSAARVSVTVRWTEIPPMKVMVVDNFGTTELNQQTNRYFRQLEADRLLAGVNLSVKMRSSPVDYSLPIRLRRTWNLAMPLEIQVPTEKPDTYCHLPLVKSIAAETTTDIRKLIGLMMRADRLLNLPVHRCPDEARTLLLHARVRFNRALWTMTDYIGISQVFSNDLRGSIRQQVKAVPLQAAAAVTPERLRRVANVGKPALLAIRPDLNSYGNSAKRRVKVR